ncbi:MAG: N-acetylglucosamine-6-phosphate deacetylase [Clostridiales bacterium GWF2_36_10]|nr:MAG: N-acetylglucosamine-6-phosphate deacetylase [Clostridiales bacterium GWF2_36_10]
MKFMVLKNGTILNENFKLIKSDIEIKEDKITRIDTKIDNNTDLIDVTGMYVLPGFIDTHMHGAYGERFNDSDPDIDKITTFLATKGITTIAATTASDDFNHLLHQFDDIVSAIENGNCGAKIAGIHAEGPFINKKLKGAMTEEYIINPTKEKIEQMLCHCKNYLKIITIAPEIENAKEAITLFVNNDVKVSIGHTNATLAEAEDGIKWGASQSTHTFNAMRPYNHREPGVLGSVLTNPKIKCEMICDFVHLHPKTIEFIYQIKGVDNINIVSDSGHTAGTNLTEFMVSGVMRYVKDGIVCLADGTIAGSTKTLLEGVQNLVSIGIPLEDVAKMASLNPAKSLGIDCETGTITVGKFADIVVLDKDLQVKYTFVNGKLFK